MDNKRSNTYYNLNTLFAFIPDNELQEIIKNANNEKSQGYGENVIITIKNTKVFTKTIPLTEREYENKFNGKNIFNLPLFYNYGVGSAGFGTWRELLMHIKTTNWVLDGQIENFPLLYHYRIIKNEDYVENYQIKPEDEANIKKSFERWNGMRTLKNI